MQGRNENVLSSSEKLNSTLKKVKSYKIFEFYAKVLTGDTTVSVYSSE